MSTAFFAFITFYIACILLLLQFTIACILLFLLLRLHHIAACVNAQEDEQQDGEAP